MAFRTVAELTLVGERRAISSDATGTAELIYSATRMFKIEHARSESMNYQINRFQTVVSAIARKADWKLA